MTVTQLHAAIGPIVLLVLVALGVGAALAAARDRAPRPLELARRAILGVIVVQAAFGLALAVRGGSPDEAIHWAYGIAVVAGLLVPGMVRPELPAGRRSMALAVGATFAAVIAWRLGASG